MIPVQTIRVRYTVTEGVLSYVVPFALYETSDVAVVWAEGEGEETALSLNQDYAVSINDERNGGTVTLVAGKVPAGATLAIVSAIPLTQEMDMSSTAEVDTDALETELDRQVQMIQQITETVDRTLKVPVTSPKTPDQVMSEILDTAARANEYAEKTEGLYNEVIAIRENTETIIIQAGNEQIERIVQEGDRQRDRAAAEADRAENAADLAQLVNCVSGARDTLTVTENLAAGSVVDLPPGLAYLVGRHHLNITYDGVSLSPSFYEEIGEAGNSSTQVKFLIPLYAGQEIDFWLIPLGEGGAILDTIREEKTGFDAVMTSAVQAVNGSVQSAQASAASAASSAADAATSASSAETKATEAAQSASEAAQKLEEMESLTATSLPAQEGNAGKFLTTDGTDASWGDVPMDACLVTDLADVPAGLRTGGIIILETSASTTDTGGAEQEDTSA